MCLILINKKKLIILIDFTHSGLTDLKWELTKIIEPLNIRQ